MRHQRDEYPRTRWLVVRFSLIALAAVIGAGVWMRHGRLLPQEHRHEAPLESPSVYGEVPDFSLLERSGRKVGLSDLRGKVWVAAFIYASCRDTCPLQSAEMAKLQQEFVKRTELRLVSISVDPGRDTPEVLSRYAERYRADPDRWLFLTGKTADIRRLAQEGFHLSPVPLVDDGQHNTTGSILHSPRLVLVDSRARVRGYYESRDVEALQRLRRDVNELTHVKHSVEG